MLRKEWRVLDDPLQLHQGSVLARHLNLLQFKVSAGIVWTDQHLNALTSRLCIKITDCVISASLAPLLLLLLLLLVVVMLLWLLHWWWRRRRLYTCWR